MALLDRQKIVRFKKFTDIPGLDKEFDSILKQITDKFSKEESAYGEIYANDDNVVTVTHTLANTYYEANGFAKGDSNFVELTSNGMRIKRAGLYEIGFHASYAHAATNVIVHTSVFVNDVEITKMETERTIATPGDFGAVSIVGFYRLKASDFIHIKFRANKTGDTTINHMNLNILEIK